jgi:membrane protein DedA with SNARE-associated domain
MTAILEFAASLDQRLMLVVLLVALAGWSAGEVWLSRSSRRDKWLWTVIVIVCPIIGCLFWFVLGPKASRKKSR